MNAPRSLSDDCPERSTDRSGPSDAPAGCWKRRARGFSLIEMVGAMAILAIVAAILTPNLARRISRAAGDKEDEALTVLAEGLSRHVRTYQTVPGAASWVTNVASMTGLSVNDVRYVRPSDTSNTRVYLIHPSFYPTNASSADPLFTQSSSGASSVTNAKILIVSSHKTELTLPVSSGRAASVSAFDAIWDWNFNPSTKSPPSGWSGSWASNGEYLHVQRVNLAPLFHRVTFSNSEFPTVYPSYQVGGASATSMSSTSTVDVFYLQGTYLKLFKDSGSGGGLDLSQSIQAAINFLYEDERWRVP